VRCAIEVQSGLIERDAGVEPDRRIEFRVGVHLGDVVEESDGDLVGEGVNIAARLLSPFRQRPQVERRIGRFFGG
jgi:adenylate cyclase